MKTIERILCSTDLTPASDEALRYALGLARVFRAQVFVCHVVESESLTEETRERISREIDAAVSESARSAALPEWTAIIAEGDAATVITREAAARHADLIVMRSWHRSYTATLLGSTAETVVHQAPCPALVTHPREREWVGADPGEIGLRRILMAHDFSDDSEAALMFALSLACEFRATLHLLHVLPDEGAALTESDFAQAENELREALPETVQGPGEIGCVVRSGIPWREILAFAEEHEIDLICLGFRGAGFARGELAGSNADQALRGASCPVLIARPIKPASFVLAESRIESSSPDQLSL
jgi:nucleotide-binding universal stress UspA family protein